MVGWFGVVVICDGGGASRLRFLIWDCSGFAEGLI